MEAAYFIIGPPPYLSISLFFLYLRQEGRISYLVTLGTCDYLS